MILSRTGFRNVVTETRPVSVKDQWKPLGYTVVRHLGLRLSPITRFPMVCHVIQYSTANLDLDLAVCDAVRGSALPHYETQCLGTEDTPASIAAPSIIRTNLTVMKVLTRAQATYCTLMSLKDVRYL